MRQLNITHNLTNRSPQVDKYLSEISKHDLINAEKEADLARRIRQGDQDALEELVNANLRFVVSVAKQYQNQGLALNDLINEGNLGLIRAAYKFDETRGFKFISYAVWWIRQAIMQAIVEQSRVIRLPQHKVGAYTKITRAFQNFEQEFQREPDVEELMEMLGMGKDEIEDYFRLNSTTISTDAPIRGLSEGTVKDILVDNDGYNPEQELMNEAVCNELNSAIGELTEREGEIISCYFGLNGKSPMTLEEIGEKFQLTRERVRQIKEKCIQRLKTSSHVNGLQVFLQG